MPRNPSVVAIEKVVGYNMPPDTTTAAPAADVFRGALMPHHSEHLPPAFGRLHPWRRLYIHDETGRVYLDAMAGVAVNTLGHGHPKLVAAIAAQAGRLIHASTSSASRSGGPLRQAGRHRGRWTESSSATPAAEASRRPSKLARYYGRQKGVDAPAIVVMERSVPRAHPGDAVRHRQPPVRPASRPSSAASSASFDGPPSSGGRQQSQRRGGSIPEPVRAGAASHVAHSGFHAGPAPHLRRARLAVHGGRGPVRHRPHRHLVRPAAPAYVRT